MTNPAFQQINTKISKSKLSPETKEIFTVLLSIFSTLQVEKDEKILQLEKNITDLEVKLREYETRTSDTISEIQQKLDGNDQYERRDTLIISGPDIPEFSAGENLKITIQNLFSQKLGLQVQNSDFSVAHRLGPKPQSGPDRRNIIFKLCRRELVSTIFRACKEHKPSFYVNMSLTPLRSKIFYVLRQCKRRFPQKIDGCQNSAGNITLYLKTSPNSSNSRTEKKVVNTRQDLERILTELDIPLNSISVNW